MTFDLRPPRKILKATTSKIKKASASKRQRDRDDSNDEDYSPNPSDMVATSSVAGVGDSSDEAVESDEDDVLDIQALSILGRD